LWAQDKIIDPCLRPGHVFLTWCSSGGCLQGIQGIDIKTHVQGSLRIRVNRPQSAPQTLKGKERQL
jgi:hypothetical protein